MGNAQGNKKYNSLANTFLRDIAANGRTGILVQKLEEEGKYDTKRKVYCVVAKGSETTIATSDDETAPPKSWIIFFPIKFLHFPSILALGFPHCGSKFSSVTLF
ncbi:hypothetical protein AVEN_251209-1 [Araneus ventricosus]|uniref:Uncharacterized protein n=1 Tax=Araneus ventricosus TaxID=182803 RepID=A0A4Y2QZQ3_ARAVE|nr:hypothetical protein AVEN_251209-1 [Araneus ventricosus]